MDLVEVAKKELDIIMSNCKSDDAREMQKEISNDILEVLQVLCNQGHSNTSAHYIIDKIRKLWLYKPLTPLTGKDDEWNSIDGNLYQSNRCPSVFKRDGRAYYLDGYAYCEPNGSSFYTCRESNKYIEFPCDPKELETEYRKLFFPSKYVPVKWANRLHLYKKVGVK